MMPPLFSQKKSRAHPALQSLSTLFILLLSLCTYRFLLSSANIYVLYWPFHKMTCAFTTLNLIRIRSFLLTSTYKIRAFNSINNVAFTTLRHSTRLSGGFGYDKILSHIGLIFARIGISTFPRLTYSIMNQWIWQAYAFIFLFKEKSASSGGWKLLNP